MAKKKFTSVPLRNLLTFTCEKVSVLDVQISGIQSDSRHVRKGDLFLAFPGAAVDGRDFIDSAFEKGAVAVLAEASPEQDSHYLETANGPIVYCENLKREAGRIASKFHGEPSKSMLCVAVTGTNGKTSVTQIVAAALALKGHKSAVIGTLGNGLLGKLEPTKNTTPGAVELQALLSRFAAEGVDVLALEASSHGLVQGRLEGLGIDVAIVTNLTRDHLDFHGSMEHYLAAKSRLVYWPDLKTLVLNRDDEAVWAMRSRMLESTRLMSFSLHNPDAEIFARDVVYSSTGVSLTVEYAGVSAAFDSPLLGEFNVYNLLASLSVLLLERIPLQEAVQLLSQIRPVPGRMEEVTPDTQHADLPLVVVDYAHTPDALEQVLKALRKHCKGNLWCVFGCGGDRDKGKRPLMGEIAAKLADKLIITSDNPRSEAVLKIIEDIEDGIAMGAPYLVELDRAAAISKAIDAAIAGDVVLLAGKGNENYQEVAGKKIPFSDIDVVRAALSKRCA